MTDPAPRPDPKPTLPGNHGQFGEGRSSEAYKPLENQPAPGEAAEGPKQTNAGERS